MRIRTRLGTIVAAGITLTGLTAPLAVAAPVPATATETGTGTDGDTPKPSSIVEVHGYSVDLNDVTEVTPGMLNALAKAGTISSAQLKDALARRLRDCERSLGSDVAKSGWASSATEKCINDVTRAIENAGLRDVLLPPTAQDCTVNGQPATLKDGVIEGTDGDDTIRCTRLTDVKTIDGLAGNDTITIDTWLAGRTVRGGEGNDTITVTGTVYGGGKVLGGDGDDSLTVNETETHGTVNGEAGNDTIRVDEVIHGAVEGGDGDDHIRVGRTTGVIYGGPGDDRIEGIEGTNHGRMQDVTGSYTTGQDGTDTCLYDPDGGLPGTVACEINNPT